MFEPGEKIRFGPGPGTVYTVLLHSPYVDMVSVRELDGWVWASGLVRATDVTREHPVLYAETLPLFAEPEPELSGKDKADLEFLGLM